jgi:predicted ribosome quality control (RQC) complex YloA/Tae2 family protein
MPHLTVIVAPAVEGLFIAKQLEEIVTLLPAQNLGWAFPNETSAALLLQTSSGIQNLVLEYRAPSPALYLSRAKLSGEARNAFQRGLELRAKGDLLHIDQLKLDRVVWLEFAPSKGFVSTESVRLLFELTGRNANLLLLETQSSSAQSLHAPQPFPHRENWWHVHPTTALPKTRPAPSNRP